MKNYIVGGCLLIIIAGIFFLGKSCGTPAQPVHAAEKKTVDSAAIVAVAAQQAVTKYRDSIAPEMRLLRDSIGLLKKRVKPVDLAMDAHVQRIRGLYDSLKAVQDNSAQLSDLVGELLDELKAADGAYAEQQTIKNDLITKLDAAGVQKDSLIGQLDRMHATLVAMLSVTQGAFNTAVAEDKRPAAQLKLYQTATKVEAIAIAALVLKIVLSN